MSVTDLLYYVVPKGFNPILVVSSVGQINAFGDKVLLLPLSYNIFFKLQ